MSLNNIDNVKSNSQAAERLSDYLKCSGDWIWEIDQTGIISFINGPDSHFLGYEYQEVLGKTIFSLMKPVSAKKFCNQLAGAVAKGSSLVNQKVSFLAQDNETIEMRVNMIPINDQNQIVTGYRGVCKDITWQEILLTNMEDSAKFPEENPMPIIRVKNDGTVIYSNLAGEKILGLWNTAMGYSLHDDLLKMLVKDPLKKNKPLIKELSYDGLVYSFNSVPILKRGYVNIYGTDITERKKFERSLKINEERYKLAQIAGNVGTWEWNKKTRELYFSEMVGEIFGYLQGTFDGRFRSLWKKIYKKDRHELLGFFNSLNVLSDSAKIDFRIKSKDGSIRWVMISGAVVLNYITNQKQIAGTVQDITDRKENEEKILTLSRGVEQSPALVLFTDPEGVIQYVNPRFTEIMGYELDELVNQTPRLFKSGLHSDVFYKKIWETILDRKNWRGEICNKNKDGKLIWFLSLISPIFDTRGELVHYLYVAEDITEKKNKEDVMIHQTLHDNLTGLPNRALFKDRLMQLLERYSRFEKKNYIGVMFIDLDKFKPVNDTMGHEAGDVVLKIVSERMANSLRKEDTVARVGGDEFAVITPDLPDVEQASKLAAKVLEAICQPMKIQDREVGISACIGIALYPKDGDDYNTLLIKADKTMYRMKRSTDNKIAFYDDSV